MILGATMTRIGLLGDLKEVELMKNDKKTFYTYYRTPKILLSNPYEYSLGPVKFLDH